MKSSKTDKDAVPPGVSERSCGPVDPYFSEADVEMRLKKQRHSTSLHRGGQSPQPGQQPGTWTGVEHRESAKEDHRESGPIDKSYKARK